MARFQNFQLTNIDKYFELVNLQIDQKSTKVGQNQKTIFKLCLQPIANLKTMHTRRQKEFSLLLQNSLMTWPNCVLNGRERHFNNRPCRDPRDNHPPSQSARVEKVGDSISRLLNNQLVRELFFIHLWRQRFARAALRGHNFCFFSAANHNKAARPVAEL